MSFLPKPEATFMVDIIGTVTQHRYHGSFTVKTVLNNGEILMIAAAVDRMGGYSPTMPKGFRDFATAICELDMLITDAPKWWKDSAGGRKLEDQNVVNDNDDSVYTKALAAGAEYVAAIKAATKIAAEAKAPEAKDDKAQTA